MVSKGKRIRNKRRYNCKFQCQCGHHWNDSDLQIQECQECDLCGENVCPIIATLETEIDTINFEVEYEVKYFGQFQCFKCLRTWFSAHAWLGFTQQCRKCETWTEAHKLRQLHRPKGMDNKNDKKKPHESDMCAKCKQLGLNCKKYYETMKKLRNLQI